MKRPKTIPRPEFAASEKLSPLELNKIHFGDRHTVLTPERLGRMSARASSSGDGPPKQA